MKTHAMKNSCFCPSLRSRGSAFTLIELLIVISIILVLSGISLKVMSMVGRKTGIAKTTMILEQLKNALAGYYSTFGSFPPVSDMDSVAPYQQPSTVTNLVGTSRGLTAYLLTGDEGGSPSKAYFNQEASKWAHYLKGLYSTGKATNTASLGLSKTTITNMTFTIHDAWDQKIHYMPHSPDFQGYTLWSDGPTGSTNDDIYITYQ